MTSEPVLIRLIRDYDDARGDWEKQDALARELLAFPAAPEAPHAELLAAVQRAVRDRSLPWIGIAVALLAVTAPLGAGLFAAIRRLLGPFAKLPLVSDLIELAATLVVAALPVAAAWRLTGTTRVPAVKPHLAALLVFSAALLFVWFEFLLYALHALASGKAIRAVEFEAFMVHGLAKEWLFAMPFAVFGTVLLLGARLFVLPELLAEAMSELAPVRYAFYAVAAVAFSILVRLIVWAARWLAGG